MNATSAPYTHSLSSLVSYLPQPYLLLLSLQQVACKPPTLLPPSLRHYLSFSFSSRLKWPRADQRLPVVNQLHALARETQRWSKPLTPAPRRHWYNDGARTVTASNSDMKRWFSASFDCGSWSQSINSKSLLKLVSSISDEIAQIVGTYFCVIKNFASKSNPNETLF